MNGIANTAHPAGGTTRPYFRRRKPASQDLAKYDSDGYHIDLRNVALPAYPDPATSSTDRLNQAMTGFDARAASVILDSAKPGVIWALQQTTGRMVYGLYQDHYSELSNAFLEGKDYPQVSKFYTPRSSSLAMMAYKDFFPTDWRTLTDAMPSPQRPPQVPPIAPGTAGERISDYLRDLINVGIMNASPGYCGTFGPGVDGAVSLFDASEGNYDMTQTHLIAMAYSYYDELTNDAREHLIGRLLADGIVHRPNDSDITTSGALPNDWARAGYISPLGLHKDLGETENHIISMLSTRYLTNQLLYQRNQNPDCDNRRNARNGGPTCLSLVLSELRNILRGDFSEYNAKPYQEEVRWPILNLATYAYDHEVRLAARMVLDYISAHIAVSSNDLRRIVPFRRRNENENVTQENGVFAIGIVDAQLGADPMAAYFAIQTGNARTYQTPNEQKDSNGNPVRPWVLGIAADGGDVTKEVLSAYRLPPLILDLFVNDLHRRFYQRLHRTPQDEAEGTRNCDNYELYASSPSYLISAGGQPAEYAINPDFGPITPPNQDQQIGVAVPTTFMPTGQSAGPNNQNCAKDLIQFSHFSDNFDYNGQSIPEYLNYGVAPDFACGHDLYLPPWVIDRLDPPLSAAPGFHFVNCGSDGKSAGFYLAIYKDGDYAFLEAFDTWLHRDVSFDHFSHRVQAQNAGINLHVLNDSGTVDVEQGGQYTTYYGTQIQFAIWTDHTRFARPDSKAGARVIKVVYGDAHPTDALGDAGNVTGPFLNGTILNSPREAVVEISNPFFGSPGSNIVLDMNDRDHPRRISETGEMEQSGNDSEVWVNFAWTGPTEGDFFHPFNTLAAAANAVANGGVIKIMPGWTTERPSFALKKRYKIIAPLGGVCIGVQ